MRRWHFRDDAPSALQLSEIAAALTTGAVVLMPTDTIYGLHALAGNEAAVARIVEIKGRPDDKAFIVLASTIEQLTELGITAAPEIMQALDSLWPAPLTVVLPRGASTLAVRIPALEWLRELLARTGPLVSTSANRSGDSPVDRPSALAQDLQSSLDVVDGGVRKAEPSAILDLTGHEPRFIREGDPFFTQKVWKTLRKTAEKPQ